MVKSAASLGDETEQDESKDEGESKDEDGIDEEISSPPRKRHAPEHKIVGRRKATEENAEKDDETNKTKTKKECCYRL
jgi:hypothetical protein